MARIDAGSGWLGSAGKKPIFAVSLLVCLIVCWFYQRLGTVSWSEKQLAMTLSGSKYDRKEPRRASAIVGTTR